MDPDASFNLATYCLAGNLDARPEQPAIVFIDADGREFSLTFAQFVHRMGQLVAALRATGLERGDRVLLRLRNGPDAALLFFAANAGGLIPVTCSTMLTRRELGLLTEATGAGLLVQIDDPGGAEGAALPPLVLHPDELSARAVKLAPASSLSLIHI